MIPSLLPQRTRLRVSEYNVGLAMLRLDQILPRDRPEPGVSPEYPAVDLCVDLRDEKRRIRCTPVLPLWWPHDLDPRTGQKPV